MDQKTHEAISFIHSYTAGGITDWKVLKKELLRLLPPDQRKLFSTRNSRTKKQTLNDFEKSVIERWKEITGSCLYLEEQ